MASSLYSVTCPCKAVQVAISAKPFKQVWCHCDSCETFYKKSPVPIALFKSSAVEIERGKDRLRSVTLTERNFFSRPLKRWSCQECSAPLLHSPDSEDAFTGFQASSVAGLKHEPQLHVFCQDGTKEQLLPFQNDGLPKWLDAPPEFGGSGEQYQF